jgi:hypothetical protein
MLLIQRHWPGHATCYAPCLGEGVGDAGPITLRPVPACREPNPFGGPLQRRFQPRVVRFGTQGMQQAGEQTHG